MESKIEIYRSPDGEVFIDVVFEQDTVWLTNSQLVTLFGSSKANISEQINIFFNRMKAELFGISEQFNRTEPGS